MGKVFLIIFLILSSSLSAGFTNDCQKEKDSLSYNQDDIIVKRRNFKDNLSDKYKGREFTYTEQENTPTTEPKQINKSFAEFIGFLASIFPYILALLMVLIVIKSFVYKDLRFWKFTKPTQKPVRKLSYIDDQPTEDQHDKLLLLAIAEQNYRLATRHYYLWSLKKMSKKKLIDYHKDKTNAQYMFEIKNDQTKRQFSYLLYLYNCVWYGEFPVNKAKFKNIENSYKKFINTL